jgi:signal transduction histidine kinase
MAGIRTDLLEPAEKIAVYPVERFVTNCSRLITDVNRLVTDINSVSNDGIARTKTNGKPQKPTLNDTISTLRKHARLFVKSVRKYAAFHERVPVPNIRDAARRDRSKLLHEFVVKISRAETLRSVVQIVGSYCGPAFDSPAGMLFIERQGQLHMVSQWRSKWVSNKYFSEDTIRKGPAADAFRKGVPIFWSQTRPRLDVSRQLHRFLPGSQCGSAVFLPITVSGERPAGVLAMVVLHAGELASETRDALYRFGEIVSGSIVRARAHDEAIAARTAAEIAHERQEEFLSVISHELRDPMTPILNWAVALSSGALPPEKQSFAIEAIMRNVRTLNRLIDDLFDGARISSGKLRLEPAEMRIQDVVREALAGTQQAAENKKLRIATDISEAIPPFFADPRRVRQVLINLLNNAVKFTREGGSIMLKVARHGNDVQCTVADTGKGIDPEFLPFVFDRFRQENRSSKTKAGGLGLGLAIVREIVELHGGSVKAYSRGADQGSAFIVRLPMRKRMPRSQGERGQGQKGQGAKGETSPLTPNP